MNDFRKKALAAVGEAKAITARATAEKRGLTDADKDAVDRHLVASKHFAEKADVAEQIADLGGRGFRGGLADGGWLKVGEALARGKSRKAEVP